MNCQKKFSNFRPFLAISPRAGSIILTREAQQRRSQNSSPNRFHSSDMRAFLESMPNVANTCCFSFLELTKENQRQGDNDRVIESVFAQWCNKEEDQSAWRDLCNNRCTMCNSRLQYTRYNNQWNNHLQCAMCNYQCNNWCTTNLQLEVLVVRQINHHSTAGRSNCSGHHSSLRNQMGGGITRCDSITQLRLI